MIEKRLIERRLEVYREMEGMISKLKEILNSSSFFPYEVVAFDCQKAFALLLECIDAEFGEEALRDMKKIIEERLEAGRW